MTCARNGATTRVAPTPSESERDAAPRRRSRPARSRTSDPPARLRRLEDRTDNPVVDPAAAQVAGEPQPYLSLARLRDAVEQRFGQHDHAGDAIAALRRLLRHESG